MLGAGGGEGRNLNKTHLIFMQTSTEAIVVQLLKNATVHQGSAFSRWYSPPRPDPLQVPAFTGDNRHSRTACPICV